MSVAARHAVRHEVTGILRATSALRVGAWGASLGVDLAVAQDGLGRLVLPGTSLAGALRAWLAGQLGEADLPEPRVVGDETSGEVTGVRRVDRLFGWLVPGSQAAAASVVHVDDAVALPEPSGRAGAPPPVPRPETRDGVALDRVTGSAATNALYQHEVVPVGTRFGFRLVAFEPVPGRAHHDPIAADVAETVARLVAGLERGLVLLGAARSRGLGGVELVDTTHRHVDLRRRDDVLAWWRGEAPVVVPRPVPVDDRRLRVTVRWAPTGPLVVGGDTVTVSHVRPDDATERPDDATRRPEPAEAATEADEVDRHERAVLTPRLAQVDGVPRLLLPGSSVKGVLRSHAERIVRTLHSGGPRPDRQTPWQDQLADQCLGPVLALFGVIKAEGEGGHRGRGALRVHDCHGPVLGDDTLRLTTHVAVDRWTGGAADNQLFTVAEPRAATWEPIRLDLDLDQLRRVTREASTTPALPLVLLLLVLRDLGDDLLALGGGTTRGRGGMRVGRDRVAFAVAGGEEPWRSLDGRSLTEVVDEPPAAVADAVEEWRKHWAALERTGAGR